MKIAFVTPEFQPLVRRTPLAEMAASLPAALHELGSDVRVFMPNSKDLDPSLLENEKEVGEVTVKDGEGTVQLAIRTAKHAGLPIVLIDHSELFSNRHPYGDEEGPYADNWRRYALFSRGVLASLELLRFSPSVLHCLDWTTGMIPVVREFEYLKQRPDHPASHAGVYFGVHNLAMQGIFEREILSAIGLPHSLFKTLEGVEHAGRVNYLKAGIEFATIIGTHSPAFANRIQEMDRGYGMEATLERRNKELVGISNGIDYHAWNPADDKLLAKTFSPEDQALAGKRRCKADLQEKLKLNSGPRTPLFVCIGRFDNDSGFKLVAQVLVPLLERNMQLALMGRGQPEIIERLHTMETTFSGRCRLIEGFSPATAHVLLAGADVQILPSHYHTSNSMCAIGMRYGVAPLVYGKSGLEDLVTDVAKDPKTGTGFLFESYTGESLMEGVDEARKFYRDASDWKDLALRCLSQDFSWQATAQEYLKAYRRVTRRVRAQRAE